MNTNVLKRFVIYMAILTFVMFTVWGFVRSFMDRPPGDYETEVCDIRLKDKKYYKIKNKIKEYQKFIKKNFNYVGDNFVHEARSLHYNNKKKSENIYGKATADEILELKDEGIDADLVPWVKDNDN